jgi:hypothetical protein
MSYGSEIPLFPWNRTPAPKAEPATPQTTRSDQSDWLTRGYTPKKLRKMAGESSKSAKLPMTSTVPEESFEEAITNLPQKDNTEPDPETPKPSRNPGGDDDPDDPQGGSGGGRRGPQGPPISYIPRNKTSERHKAIPKIKHKLAEAADFAGWVRSLKMCLYKYNVDEDYIY